jgi:hypothetical protein
MINPNPSVVPLQKACLCLDCEMIVAAHTNCSACGSTALLNIARALSRPGYLGDYSQRDRSNAAIPPAYATHSGDFMHNT